MKIKEEQLKTIQDQQQKVGNILSQIGVLETQKHSFLHEIAALNDEINIFKSTLEKEYGAVEINLESGECTPIKSKEPVVDHV